MGSWSQSGVGRYQATERDVCVFPRSYNFDATKRPVVYAHSFGQDAMEVLLPTQLQPATATLADAGLPVVSGDLAGTATWGNDTAQARYGTLKTFSQGAIVQGKAGTVLGLAFSMGALTLLNWARANPTLLAAIALICPVVDLAYEHDNNINGFAAGIETAYTNLAGYTAAVATHDPMQNTAAHTSGPPIHIWRASDDAIAVTARQDAFISAVGCPWSDMGSVGHHPATVNTTDVLTFLNSHA
jgi:pimeloyl-ACP methyl ester carboxylesterase